LLSIASAILAGLAFFRGLPQAEAVVSSAIVLPLWAFSAAAVGRMRRGIRNRAPADLVTCFGAGYTPKGSGTVGALTAIPIGWLLSQVEPIARASILTGAAAASIAVCYWYMAGGNDSLDPKEVVLDEHVGVLIAFAVVPWDWAWIAAAFVLFRIFDIWKPWPIGWLDRTVKNPAGVMLDDFAAGLMAATLLALARQHWE
jgi:phosphatidylglycerophosphatase A